MVTRGQLTVGFSEPAAPPWFGGEAAIAYPGEPEGTAWEISDPYSAEGFESALAYAVAPLVGVHTQGPVQWVNVEREAALAPGSKPFDFYLSQAPTLPASPDVSYSRSYYELNYAILGLFANPIAEVTTTDALRAYRLGAVESSPGLTLLSDIVQPTTPPSGFADLDAARAALEIGDIDGLAIDLPTAFRLRDEEIPGAVVVGQFEATDGDLGVITSPPNSYSAVLPKDSVYTGCVDGALEALDSGGTLDALRRTWLADRANAPILE